MPDQYYQSTLTGQQLDEAFAKLGQVDESAAARPPAPRRLPKAPGMPGRQRSR